MTSFREKIGSKSSGPFWSGTDTRTETDSGGTEIHRRKRRVFPLKVSGTYQPGFQPAGIEQSQERLPPVNVLHRGSFRQLAQGTFDERQPILCRKLPRTLQPCGLSSRLGGQLSRYGGTRHGLKLAIDSSTTSPALAKTGVPNGHPNGCRAAFRALLPTPELCLLYAGVKNAPEELP